MKKTLLYLLPLVAMSAGFAACDDDDDLPNVDFQVEFQDVTLKDNVIYVVQGEPLTVKSVTVINNEKGKEAVVSGATYYWDYVPVGSTGIAPYTYTLLTTENTPIGRHELQIETRVFAVDKSPAVAVMGYTVEVVADETDLPDTSDSPTLQTTPTVSAQDK